MITQLQFSWVLESRMNLLNLIESFLRQLDIKGFDVLLQEQHAISSLLLWITKHKNHKTILPREDHATEGERRDRAADNGAQSAN